MVLAYIGGLSVCLCAILTFLFGGYESFKKNNSLIKTFYSTENNVTDVGFT